MSVLRIVSNLCLMSILFCYTNSLHAQSTEKIASTNNAVLFGIGQSSLYDTYLSPLRYSGTSYRLMHEQMRKTSWFDHRFNKQQLIELELNNTQNPIGNATLYGALLTYNWGGHYNLMKTDKLRVSVGGLWSLAGGVLYNQRNSNNPASARGYTNLQASVIAFYDWKGITFRGQVDTPMLGVLFSPSYAQSYYEISLGNRNDIIHFASLHNQRALRTYLTADVPLSNVTLRVGYLGSFYQTKINYIHTHNYSHSLVVGIVWESINFSGKKIKTSNIVDSSYY